MKWDAPLYLHGLWILLIWAAAIGMLQLTQRRRQDAFIGASAAEKIQLSMRTRWQRVRLALWFMATFFIILSLARPQWGFHLEEVRRKGIDVMVVFDTSKSMLAEDIKPNRMQQAKWGVLDLIAQLQGDRVGLVAFSGSSFLSCPLTADYAALQLSLDDLYAGIIPRGGTAIAQALQTAMDSFEQDRTSDRAILLITDGEDHEGDPLGAIKELKAKNIRVYAIGMGTRAGELIRLTDTQGQRSFLKNEQGHVVKSALREDVLEQLALGTGGMYVRSVAGDLGFDRIYEQGLSTLESASYEAKMMKTHEERFTWALLPSFVLLVLEASIKGYRRRPEDT